MTKFRLGLLSLVLLGMLAACQNQVRVPNNPVAQKETEATVQTAAAEPTPTATPQPALAPTQTATPPAVEPTTTVVSMATAVPPTATATPEPTAPSEAAEADTQESFYVPDAPERESVGERHMLPDIAAPTLFEIAWNDREDFRTGLIEPAQEVLEELPGATVYHIDLVIGDDLVNITGQQEVLYTNREDVPLNEVYFRLFPNLASGSTTIANLTVNGDPVEPVLEQQKSAMRVPLASPLQPGDAVVLRMDFAVRVPRGEGGNYGTFAYIRDVLALAHFYPMIAVYDDEGWNIEIAPAIGDVVSPRASGGGESESDRQS